jgi:hypothetical protein
MSNNCKCPKPRGGEIHCESNQIAICRVKNGEVQGWCITPSRTLNLRNVHINSLRDTNFLKKLFSEVIEREVSLFKIEEILVEGSYNDPQTRIKISLSLPINRNFN